MALGAAASSEKAYAQIQPIDGEHQRYKETHGTEHPDCFERIYFRLRKRDTARKRFNNRDHAFVPQTVLVCRRRRAEGSLNQNKAATGCWLEGQLR